MKTYFKNFGVSNITKYYILVFLFMSWFPTSSWLFYFTKYMSVQTAGLIDGIAILIGLLAEVPTGAFGDLIGKKKSLILGYLSMLAACTLFVLADQTAIFLVANIILFIGISFISGSQEALSYDSLLEKQKKEHYAHVSANASIISNISLLFSFAFGGFLYSIEPWLPWFGMAVTSGIALILSFTLVEPTIDSDKFSISRYIEKTAAGFNNLLSKSMRSLFIPIIVVSSIGYLSTGIVRQSAARYFGFGGDTLGYLLAVIILLAILILYNFERLMKKFSEFNFISSLLIVFVLAYGIPIFSGGKGAGVIFFLLTVVAIRLSEPLVSTAINHKIKSEDRATTLSTLSLIKQIPYVIVAVFFAGILQPARIQTFFLVVVVITIFFLLFGKIINIKENQGS